MTNNNAINLWDKVLREYCHCYPDIVGNRPCDNGCLCDRCMSKDVKEIYNSLLKENNN